MDSFVIRWFHLKQGKTSEKSAELLAQVARSKVPKTLKMLWKDQDEPEKYLFQTQEQKERFYEAAFWVARRSIPTENATEDVTVFIGSWNVGKAPPPDSLHPWIPENSNFDIIVVGVQECEYNARSGESSETDFSNCIQNTVGSKYIKISSLSLLGIRLYVLVKREHYYKISQIKKGTEATGLGNVVGNKGGVGVSFTFNETRFCFVTCHLAAHLVSLKPSPYNYTYITQI